MTNDLVLLALLMGAVTYPSRAVPMLVPGIERLPDRALLYLRLVGPAVLASIAASETLVRGDSDTGYAIVIGPEILGVLACMAIVAWRRNLFLGLVVGVGLVAALRFAGMG
jgi:branched-subunit amino acid transport protein